MFDLLLQDCSLKSDNSLRPGQGDEFLLHFLKKRAEQKRMTSPGEDTSTVYTFKDLMNKVQIFKAQNTEESKFERILQQTAAVSAQADGPLGLGVVEARGADLPFSF